MVEDLADLLQELGMNTSTMQYNIFDPRTKKHHTYYRASINGKSSLKRWHETIGTNHPNHKKRFLNRLGHNPKTGTIPDDCSKLGLSLEKN